MPLVLLSDRRSRTSCVACPQADLADARQALYRLHDGLDELNPIVAVGLMEGLEETLTLHESQAHLSVNGETQRANRGRCN
jgi:hypothetical protein